MANFSFQFVPLAAIERYIREIAVCKSSGIINLSSLLLKDAFMTIAVELAHIINESIRTATFPDAWAVGSIGNWHPISILPLPSKLLERAVHFQISSYPDKSGLLSTHQHGFRPGKSTSTAILDLTRLLTNNYNIGNHTSCMFVDYKKAFETLDHKILLNKLV